MRHGDRIRATDGGVEILGTSVEEARQAFAALEALRALGSDVVLRGGAGASLAILLDAKSEQVERSDRRRAQLLELLLTDPDAVDPVPRATLDQVRRAAHTRNRLLISGAYSTSDLVDMLGKKPAAVRQWLRRRRDAGRVFTVQHGDRTYLPAFLLDEAAEPFPELARTIRPLRDAGVAEWALWVWFDAPSSWLGGGRPVELVAERAFDRLAVAARDHASNAAV